MKDKSNAILNAMENYKENNRIFTIYKVSWDRIWISFFIKDVPSDAVVTITSINDGPSFDLKKGEADNEFKLNITNPGDCKMLPTGIYKLVIHSDSFSDISSAKSNIYVKELHLDNSINTRNIARQFIYFHNERAYRVQFSSKNGFKIKTSDIELPGLSSKQKLTSLIRRSRHNLAKTILRTIYNGEYLLFHRKGTKDIHKIKKPNILLMSDQSEEMGSNMAAFKEALIREGYTPNEALRAVTTKHYSIFHWILTLKKIASADFIFLDDHSQTTDWLTIRGAIITQLWHAGAGFKSTGYSRFGMPASPAPKSGHRQYTYGVAGSKKIRHFFSEVWGINDEQVLPAGMPRLDEFLDEDYIKTTKIDLLKNYQILCKPECGENSLKKRDNIILFAPTYRGENKRTAYFPYDRLDMDQIYKLCQDIDAVFLFKMHPFVEEKVPIPEKYSDRLADFTAYPNINDLFYVTDLLITDYSSSIYEFSLMKKPMLFYAFDIDQYTKERGFHRDYRENVPGKIVETFDDMLTAIRSSDFEFPKVEKYLENNFDHIDTHASERIIDWVIHGKAH